MSGGVCPMGPNEAKRMAAPHKYPYGWVAKPNVATLPPVRQWCMERQCSSPQTHSWRFLAGVSLAYVRCNWTNFKDFDFSGCIVPPGTNFDHCDFRYAKKEGINHLKKNGVEFTDCLF